MAPLKDTCWVGDLDGFQAAFARLTPTECYSSTRDGLARSFDRPSRADYEAALRASADLGEGDDLGKRPDLVAASQAHWHASGGNGCHFASYLSGNRSEYGWTTWVLAPRLGASELAAAVHSVARDALPAAETAIVSFVFPHLVTATDFAELIRALVAGDGWALSEREDPSDATLALLGLTVEVGSGYRSEILGFGPGTTLANTRRAPFSELAIRSKKPARPRPGLRANMADIVLTQDRAVLEKWGEQTARTRAARLGDSQDHRGKAKVTAVAPRA